MKLTNSSTIHFYEAMTISIEISNDVLLLAKNDCIPLLCFSLDSLFSSFHGSYEYGMRAPLQSKKDMVKIQPFSLNILPKTRKERINMQLASHPIKIETPTIFLRFLNLKRESFQPFSCGLVMKSHSDTIICCP